MTISLLAVSLDGTDAERLARFWSDLLGRPLDDGATADFASIGMAGAGTGTEVWMFHRVPEPKTAKNRTHVDLASGDLEKAVARALDLGARHLADVQEGAFSWATLADPEGNEFDIVAV